MATVSYRNVNLPDRASKLGALAAAALDDQLDSVVDMVYFPVERDLVCVRGRRGEVLVRRATAPDGGPNECRVESVSGVDPIGAQHEDRFLGVDQELSAGFPDPEDNSFPHAYEQVVQFFDGDHAPDLVVQHHPAHSYGGNIGQHGSLSVTQARAPFLASGPGVLLEGIANRSLRMVDVAPTICHLLGLDPVAGSPGAAATHLRRQDGAAEIELFAHSGAHRVQVILLDGVNHNALWSAVSEGRCPNLARLAGGGVGLGNGLFASSPTSTLANHTAANTGLHPGHTGVLNHTWFDRGRSTQPDLLEFPEMFTAASHLTSGVETLHEAVHRHDPDAWTFAAFEFCDRGADASSFAPIRAGVTPALVDPSELTDYGTRWIAECKEYAFMSQVDERAVRDAIGWWDGSQGNPTPRFGWLSLSVTDEAGHVSGPHSEMTSDALADSDRRIGHLLAAIDRAGAFEETAVLVFSDHGMAGSDPENTESYRPALDATGIPYQDVGDGFIYL